MTFFDAPFKQRVEAAIAEIEGQTSAEVVVAVRPVSGTYWHVTWAVGAVSAFLALCVFLYHPAEFEFTYLPLELAGAFVVGSLLSTSVKAIPRTLSTRRYQGSAVEQAASAAFTEYGVHKTRGRTGLLVFVSTFERRAVLRPDVGVPAAELAACAGELDASVRQGPESFLASLRRLAPMLADKLPRAADDVNELADGVKGAG